MRIKNKIKSLKVAIVAGESSGDLLAAGLINEIKKRVPNASFYGIAGDKMAAAGCEVMYPSEKLAIMGLFEVLPHLRELLSIRKNLYQRIIDDKPDVFIGVDAPDFNLPLAKKLKAKNIKTMHYVSPSVWAWRQNRIHKIADSIDRMLTLFPFEANFYRKHRIDVRFVGHPLADMVPVNTDKSVARAQLEIPVDAMVLALLPGSRQAELNRLAKPFLEAAVLCCQKYPRLRVVTPLATDATHDQFTAQLNQLGSSLPIDVIRGRSHLAIQAADYVLVASGTATLEATLIARPMVVAYKLAPLTYWILKTFKILKVNEYSLPNLLAGARVVEELIQNQATPENMAAALIRLIENPEKVRELEGLFSDIYRTLKCNANEQAAEAVLELCEQKAV